MSKYAISEAALADLRQFIGSEGTLEIDKDGRAQVRYADGTVNLVSPSDYNPHWKFAGCGFDPVYAAGYAAACGYHD